MTRTHFDTVRAVSMLFVLSALVAGCDRILEIKELPVGTGGALGTGSTSDASTTATTATTTSSTTAMSSTGTGCPANPGCGPGCPKLCDGAQCMTGTQCKHGHCVEGICCAIACGTCQQCAGGTQCTNVLAGTPDPACNGTPAQACNGAGACKAALGAPCMTLSDCSAGVCLNFTGTGLCKLEPTSPCTSDVQCGQGFCKQGTCATCTASPDDCPGGRQCNASVTTPFCLLPNGAYCVANANCNSGTCTMVAPAMWGTCT